MHVRVLFFSSLRDLAGGAETEMELPGGSRVADLMGDLGKRIPGLKEWDGRLLVAVGHEYAGMDRVLEEGEEVAVMPPVQGG